MATKRKTRMYEPWGYRDQDNYQSTESIIDNDFYKFFAGVNYKKSDQIVERAWYEDGKIYIKFTNGDIISIDVKELLDENEFKDGLQVVDGVVSVLRDSSSERWLTVSEDGVKVAGIQAEIDRLDDRIDTEITRATGEETRIESRLNKEIQDRIDDVDAEEVRAKAAEQVITTNLNNEITRATRTEQLLNTRVDTLNDELDAEESIREANDAALGLRITTETNDRISAIAAEKSRAEAAENRLNLKIEAESERAIQKEIELDERIDEISSGSSEEISWLLEKLGYKNNDTLITTNEHEVAFGEWNISNTDAIEPSGQTIFSIGVGTSAHGRKNAFEVRKDGSVYMWVEGDFIRINNLLAQLTNEVYDSDSNP